MCRTKTQTSNRNKYKLETKNAVKSLLNTI